MGTVFFLLIQLLIGYVHNYLELWDALTWRPITFYGCYKEDGVEDMMSVTWHPAGNQFVSAHSDGSLAFWNVDKYSQPVKVQKPYGKQYEHILSNWTKCKVTTQLWVV